MNKYIYHILFLLLGLIGTRTGQSQDCITFHSDFSGMEWDAAERALITTAACDLKTLINEAGVQDFEVHTFGFYGYNPNMAGGTEQVWQDFLDSYVDPTSPHLAIGKEIDLDGSFKKFWVSFHMPETNCISQSASDKIQTKLSKFSPSASSNQSPISILTDCLAELKLLNCLCGAQDPYICLKDINRRLTRDFGFRKTQIEIGSNRTWALGANGIYDFFGKEVKINGIPYYIPDEVNESKTEFASSQTITTEDTTIVSSGVNGLVFILDEESFTNGEWDNMQSSAANVDYVECWVVLKDEYGNYWLYSRFSFGPFNGVEGSAVRSDINYGTRGATLSPWGAALKVLGNSAIDAVVQAVIIRITDSEVNDWEKAFKKVDYLGAAWSGLSSLLPWNSNKSKFGKAILDGFAAVAGKAISEPSYTVTQALKDFVIATSASLVTSFLPAIINKAELFLDGAFRMISRTVGGQKVFAKAIAVKCFILGGCFVPGTPVFAASDVGQATIPIERIQLFDQVAAHTTVNATYGLTASTDHILLTKTSYKDPYTSDEQRERDSYQLNDTEWYSVTFDQVEGQSQCQLALHQDWMAAKGYAIDQVVHLNLPEQGISGPFRITHIKHILPQKIPESELTAGFEYRPVTGIFTHYSDQVLMVHFESGDSLGITENHPVYSASDGEWKHALELEIGEVVLSYHGEARVKTIKKLTDAQLVYNLEVKDLHNFLVGDDGVVVHNSCWTKTFSYGSGLAQKTQKAIDHIWEGHNPLSKIKGKSYFRDDLNTQVKIKKFINNALSTGNATYTNQSDGSIYILVELTEIVGKKKNHVDNTNFLTIIMVGSDIKNAFPGQLY